MQRVLDDLTDLRTKDMLSPEKIDARLRRSGVPSRILHRQSRDTERYMARYLVKVNGFDSPSVKQSMRGGSQLGWDSGESLSGDLEDGLHKRMGKAAIRTLYALGTDLGEVQIIALPGRRYAVEQVVLGKKYPDEGKHGKWHDPKGSIAGCHAEILMGMDPEFVLVNRDGLVVPASLYLERKGTAGCDAVRQGDEVSYPLAELRPAPQPHPDRLLYSMRQALQEAQRSITDHSLSWKAGGLPVPGLPLGGHIHFSGVPLTLSVLQCLDNYLALPLSILEDPAGRARRPRYGYLGDYRRQPYGGFEYRTLPSFLVSPLIAKASLYMAHLVALHYGRLRARPLNRERYHKAYYEGKPAVLKEVAAKLHQDFTQLPEYGSYAEVIDRLFERIDDGRTWDESRDIRRLWNIPAVP